MFNIYTVYESVSKISKTMSDTKEETKEEKQETRETRSEASLDRERDAAILEYLMTNPDTGDRWSYAESRMRYG